MNERPPGWNSYLEARTREESGFDIQRMGRWWPGDGRVVAWVLNRNTSQLSETVKCKRIIVGDEYYVVDGSAR